MTRAIPIIVERSPSNGSGWMLTVGDRHQFRFCTAIEAMAWVWRMLVELGAEATERARVVRLVMVELRRVRRAVVTAEVLA